MATFGDLINGALRDIGQLAEGETPSSDMSNDALTSLNDMLDSWNTEGLALYYTQEENFSWASGNATRTMGGSNASFSTTRPVKITGAWWRSSNIDYPITMINVDQYGSYSSKTDTTSLPEYLYVEMSYPNVTLKALPVPSQTNTIHILSQKQLAAATLAGTFSLPQGYSRAIRKNLAVELAHEYGVTPLPGLVALAVQAKRNIKRVNSPDRVMSVPVFGAHYRSNITAGE